MMDAGLMDPWVEIRKETISNKEPVNVEDQHHVLVCCLIKIKIIYICVDVYLKFSLYWREYKTCLH